MPYTHSGSPCFLGCSQSDLLHILRVLRLLQWLREHICEHHICLNVLQSDLLILCQLSYVMRAYVNMLRPCVKLGVLNECNGTLVVAIYYCFRLTFRSRIAICLTLRDEERTC